MAHSYAWPLPHHSSLQHQLPHDSTRERQTKQSTVDIPTLNTNGPGEQPVGTGKQASDFFRLPIRSQFFVHYWISQILPHVHGCVAAPLSTMPTLPTFHA